MRRDYDRPSEWDSFVFYKSFYGPISELSNEQLGRLFRHLFTWQIEGFAEPEQDISMAFRFIVNQFRIDDCKRLEICARNRANILKRWNTNVYDRIRPNTNDTNVYHNDNDNDNDNENKNGNVVKSKNDSLPLPYPDNPEFVSTWNELRATPKWRNKSERALKMALKQLAKYDVRFSVSLMQSAIVGNYQGVTYPDTPVRYEQWKRSNPGTREETPTVSPITDIDNLYND